MSEGPAVSVIIPCFNAVDWVEDAVKSARAQVGIGDLEVIVVDDGSADGSARRLRQHAGILLIEQEHVGSSAARNIGLKRATGKYVQFLDADDYLLPGKIAGQVAALEASGADVAYSDWRSEVCNGTGVVRGPVQAAGSQEDVLSSLLGGWWVALHAYLYRRSVLDAVCGWDERYQENDDLALALRLALHGARFEYVPGCHAVYRRLSSATLSSGNPLARIRNGSTLFLEAAASLEGRHQLTPKRRSRVARSLFHLARSAYELDRSLYRELVQASRAIDPDGHEGERFLYRAARRLCGDEGADYLAAWRHRPRGEVRHVPHMLDSQSRATVGNPLGEERRFRLAVLNSHPIQYFAPLYRRLSQEQDIDLTVYYCSLQGANTYVDAGFDASVEWDVPLLRGYRWCLLPNLRGRCGVDGFWSLINPAIVTEIARGRYDAIWVHGHGYATHMLAVLVGRMVGIPILMRGDTHLGLRRAPLRRALRSVVMRATYTRLCAACLPVGTANRQFYRSLGVPDDRLFLVPYAVDNDRFKDADGIAVRSQHGIAPDQKVVLYVSKMTPRKRPRDLLRAYTMLRERRPDVALVFVGSGSEECDLRREVEQRAISDVYFLGFRNQSELPALYAAADVFVLPSADEPWGLVINEAMCAGLPIVTTDEVGAAPDLIDPGKNGYVYKTGDVAALCDHLTTIVTEDALRARMGQRSREIVAGWGFDQCVAGLRQALAATGSERHVSPGALHRSMR